MEEHMRIQSVAVAVVLSLISISTLPKSASADTESVKDWTFLVYLNGNNSLDSFGPMNIEQMEKVGSTDKVNVVVQWASLAAKKTVRLLVKKSSDPTKVTSPVVQDLGNADMGDYRSLIEFIKWGAEKYPAKHYFVDVWDHGSGWHGRRIDAVAAQGGFKPLDISWDDNTGHFMTTKQLGQALAEGAKAIGHKIDVYGSDACLMAMAEVANEVTDSVSIYTGSQEVEPGAGWPYDALLAQWNAKASASPADVGKILTTEYTNSYKGGENGNQEVTFAAYDLAQITKFNTSITALGKELSTLDTGSRKKVVTALSSVQYFTDSDYLDLVDFLNNVDAAGLRGISKVSIKNVKDAVNQLVIANNVTTQYAKARGVSIWVPGSLDQYKSYADLYKSLNFEARTHWSETLKYVLQDATSGN